MNNNNNMEIDAEYQAIIYVVNNHQEAAKKIYELYPFWIFCKSKLYVFNNDNGLWISCITTQKNIVNTYLKNIQFRKKDVNIQCNDTITINKILLEINRINIDDKWIENMQETSLNKLLFNNGIYDASTNMFYPKYIYGFNPAILFLGKLHYDFISNDQVDPIYINDIYRTLFINTLGDIEGNYFLEVISRAIMGNNMNHSIFGSGSLHCGKNTLIQALHSAFDDYICVFYETNITDTPYSSKQILDKHREHAYVMSKYRIITTISINYTHKLNIDKLKLLAESKECVYKKGSEYVINYIPHTLPICFGNDLSYCNNNKTYLDIHDEYVSKNLKVFKFKNTFVEHPNPLIPTHMRILPNILEEINSIKFKQHFIKLCIHIYLNWVNNGSRDNEPIEIQYNKSHLITM